MSFMLSSLGILIGGPKEIKQILYFMHNPFYGRPISHQNEIRQGPWGVWPLHLFLVVYIFD